MPCVLRAVWPSLSLSLSSFSSPSFFLFLLFSPLLLPSVPSFLPPSDGAPATERLGGRREKARSQSGRVEAPKSVFAVTSRKESPRTKHKSSSLSSRHPPSSSCVRVESGPSCAYPYLGAQSASAIEHTHAQAQAQAQPQAQHRRRRRRRRRRRQAHQAGEEEQVHKQGEGGREGGIVSE